MQVEVVVALISAAVALVAGVVSARSAQRAARLQDELERRRHQATKEELLAEVMGRYREPLLRAAFDLQSRIYNIVAQGFLARYLRHGQPAERAYARANTQFVLAEYLGWVEILRRGVQFLDLGDVERNRLLVDRLEAITTALSTDRRFADPCMRLFRGQQRAIGELMIDAAAPTATGGEHARQCMGYAAFVARLEGDEAFGRWFGQLGDDVDRLGAADPADPARLVALQHALLDLIDYLDDPPTRFPAEQRTRL